jgi:hypothetical protein
MTPFPFQEADIASLLAHGGRGFVMAEPGAGKTLIAVEVGLRGDYGTKLIVAPQGTLNKVWRKTLLEQDPDAVVRRLDSSPKGQDAWDALQWGEPGWYLISPQLYTLWATDKVFVDTEGERGTPGAKYTERERIWPELLRVDLAIVDEAHLLGGGGTASTALKHLHAGARIVMSGTMVRNKIENFWPLLRWVYPELRGDGELADINRHRWIIRWLETEYDRFAPGNIKVVGEREPGAIANAIPCYVQHFKRARCCAFHPNGFLDDVPEPTRETIEVELTATQQQLITRMEDTYTAWLEQEAKDANRALIAKLPIDARIRLRQMTLGVPSFAEDGTLWFAPDCESPKLDALIALHRKVAEPIVATMSSKTFAHEAVRRLNALGLRAFEWSGDVTQKRRDAALDAFTAGEYDIVVGVVEAIGTGIDGLQGAAGVLVRLERSEDLASEIQLESRVDRRGQLRAGGVLNVEIIAKDSMDEGIVSRQLQKRLDLNKSLRRTKVAA